MSCFVYYYKEFREDFCATFLVGKESVQLKLTSKLP
jgi:hypothetical protein